MLTAYIAKFYHTRFNGITAMDILEFSSLFQKHIDETKKVGLTDPRLEKVVADLMASFYFRIYKNIMPLVLEVLKKMQTDYQKEKQGQNSQVCVTYGHVDLFKFMNQVLDYAMSLPRAEVLKGVLGLIYK